MCASNSATTDFCGVKTSIRRYVKWSVKLFRRSLSHVMYDQRDVRSNYAMLCKDQLDYVNVQN